MASRINLVSPSDRGVYVLLLRVKRALNLQVGRLGRLSFPNGYYVYVGSALGQGGTSLRARTRRHIFPHRRARWHIDYLTTNRGVEVDLLATAHTLTNRECRVSRNLAKLGAGFVHPGFGSSDCRESCPSHLLSITHTGLDEASQQIASAISTSNLSPHIILIRNVGNIRQFTGKGFSKVINLSHDNRDHQS